MRVEILDDRRGRQYDDFLRKDPHSLFFASNRYRLLLKQLLHAEDRYLLLLDDADNICGALPLFIYRNERFGSVVNSLPFYGSNGAVIAPDLEEGVRNELLTAYRSIIEELDCVSATIITSPFEERLDDYEFLLVPTYIDHRIGQLTPLPSQGDALHDRLLSIYHQYARHNVRKAMKGGFDVVVDPNPEALNFLIQTHVQNMREINGRAKPEQFFRLISTYFEYGTDYRLYCAYKDGRPAAGLLMFYFNRTAEYFTPVVRPEYRSEQPLSLLIHVAMADAVEAGYSVWNWGGTWLTQDGVYRFKKRWGTVDKPYYYYINIRCDSILRLSRDQLIDEFPFFYIAPFDKLIT